MQYRLTKAISSSSLKLQILREDLVMKFTPGYT
jgi:hypothetical protein